MALCKDQVTKELNERGYNLVKLPRVGIEPMDVLGRDGESLEKLGSIAEVWTSSVAPPSASPAVPAAGISGSKSSDVDIAIGLKLLSNALAGLGAGISLPSLTTAFKHAHKVQFTFENVESTSITPFALGKFLAQGTLDMSNPFVSKYFGNDETQEYIIFDVLKSDSLSVTAKSDTGASVDTDVGFLNGAMSANLKAQVGASEGSEITFKGPVKVTFAFKLYEVVYANGKWIPQGAAADDDLSFLVDDEEGASPAPRGVIINASRLLNLKM
jgi:hypothetical protein